MGSHILSIINNNILSKKEFTFLNLDYLFMFLAAIHTFLRSWVWGQVLVVFSLKKIFVELDLSKIQGPAVSGGVFNTHNSKMKNIYLPIKQSNLLTKGHKCAYSTLKKCVASN